jgi:hypothetical protein
MAAGTWKVFNLAKFKLGNSTLSLSATVFKLALFSSTSNLKTSGSALPRGVYNSLTQEVTGANGYTTGGLSLAGENWTSGRSAKEYKFLSSNLTFTATGGTIPNIRFAAIYISAAASANRHLLCYVTLTSAQFTLAQNNTCTIQCPANGILMLA